MEHSREAGFDEFDSNVDNSVRRINVHRNLSVEFAEVNFWRADDFSVNLTILEHYPYQKLKRMI